MIVLISVFQCVDKLNVEKPKLGKWPVGIDIAGSIAIMVPVMRY